MREEGERDGGIKLLFGGLCDLGSQDSKESEDRKFARFAIEEARKSVAENDEGTAREDRYACSDQDAGGK